MYINLLYITYYKNQTEGFFEMPLWPTLYFVRKKNGSGGDS